MSGSAELPGGPQPSHAGSCLRQLRRDHNQLLHEVLRPREGLVGIWCRVTQQARRARCPMAGAEGGGRLTDGRLCHKPRGEEGASCLCGSRWGSREITGRRSSVSHLNQDFRQEKLGPVAGSPAGLGAVVLAAPATGSRRQFALSFSTKDVKEMTSAKRMVCTLR